MPTNTELLVRRFYDEVWNKADENVAREILHPDFRFRGSLGQTHRGPDGFIAYLRAVHQALGDYTCIIDDLVAAGDKAAARMTFEGIHKGAFFGVKPTGKSIRWAGAAFFSIRDTLLAETWVIGDIDSIKRQIGAGEKSEFSL